MESLILPSMSKWTLVANSLGKKTLIFIRWLQHIINFFYVVSGLFTLIHVWPSGDGSFLMAGIVSFPNCLIRLGRDLGRQRSSKISYRRPLSSVGR